MRFNTLHHIHKMLQNWWRKSFLITQNPGASGGGGLRPPGSPTRADLLETLSGSQTPRRLSSPLTQNPGSAPEMCTRADVFNQENYSCPITINTEIILLLTMLWMLFVHYLLKLYWLSYLFYIHVLFLDKIKYPNCPISHVHYDLWFIINMRPISSCRSHHR
jgi:hypothetical protein